ncbi:hypothetical protein, partial [Flavobacterium sp.]|uniref:hypothetical protein n=1 Tax=Flavobacterium sp. TaxID=239 RepID=UPI0038FC45C0
MKQIRESKFSKIVAYYLMIMMILQVTQPMQMYALTGGPTQPEFNSFTPIGTSDMVDLASGDFNYNIPIMDVGGYPLNLAYNSGVTMDQEASWTGLGWDLGVGQIARQVRGIPDDFNGDQMVYENNMKKNTTIGSNFNVFLSPFGVGETPKSGGSGGVSASVGFGVGIKYNSYDGFGCSTNAGLTFAIGDNLSVGMQLENSSTDGVSASPSISLSAKTKEKEGKNTDLSVSAGVSMNSRKGVESVTMSASAKRVTEQHKDGFRNDNGSIGERGTSGNSYGGSIGGGSLSFAPADFTPSKRVGMSSVNAMFNLNVEGAVYGVDPGFKFSGYRNSQGIKSSEKFKIEKAFGYENTSNAGSSDILDFNREKDRTVNRNTVSLPVTNYTYDLYNVQGQGVGGMFRPYRSQVGYVYDNFTQDDSASLNIGVELGAGAGAHVGVDLDGTKSKSYTGLWEDNNPALSRFNENETGNKPNYEKVLFKNIGGAHVDKDMIRLLNNELGGYEPISFKLTDNAKFHRNTSLQYYKNVFDDASVVNLGSQPYIKRGNNRLNRNQVIQKISREEAGKFGSKTFSPYSKKSNKNHTAEIRIIKDGGEQYNYGRAAYNSVKREVTFDVSGANGNCKTGLVQYNPGKDNSAKNSREGDQYFNRITTPAYAHSYLLTSVLSSDYQDTDKEKGPSDGDLGTYTKFSYTNKSVSSDGVKTPYKWRVPYGQYQANYDEGLRSSVKDDKGSYQYGEKELLYINKIETKTHVAIFTISERKDGHGVIDENGGGATSEASKMWKLDKISLYSKPEYLAHKDDLENAVPIKVAHFEYNYSLCKGIENNIDFINKTSGLENTEGGKLTLKKVYFTYR